MTPPRGMYIWHLEKIRKDYLVALKKANCRRVYLKTLDDATPGIFWEKQCTKEVVKSFNNNGQEVVAWGYLFDKRTSTDVAGITEAVKKSIEAGCIGFVADVESELENAATHAQVKELMLAIRKVVPAGELGYTSFGNPESHSQIPWSTLNQICDYAQPQMYYSLWNFATNEQEIKMAFAQHKKFGLDKKPIYPIFTCEQKADVKELQTYLDRYPGSSIYAAQLPQAWELNYFTQPVPIPDNPREIIEWRLNHIDNRDLRGFDANGKCVCWIDTENSLEKMYYGTVMAGAARCKFTTAVMDKKPGSVPTSSSNVQKFVKFWKENYLLVDKEVERWFAGKYSPDATKNACVAHQFSCLALCGLDRPKQGTVESVNVDAFAAWSLKNGWTKITDLEKLQPGDLCCSGTLKDLTHIFCFIEYKTPDIVKIYHNQEVGLCERSLLGIGCGATQFALRMP